ncbi:MAG: RNA-directed DNA polymerase [Candidatus Eisenbacteria sp.]|nr:RNA-directed DNA polymerase [Candidatus Eisenbacteria bacterium]
MSDDWFPDPIRFKDQANQKSVLWGSVAPGQTCVVRRSEVFNVPKVGFTLRYALQGMFSERVFYQALVDAIAPLYDPLLDPRVYSCRIRSGRSDYMFCPPVVAWRDFIADARETLSSRRGVLLKTDIQNYYESISIGLLASELLRIGPKRTVQETVDTTQQLLLQWCPYGDHGIPQNRDASAFLANAFLKSVDNTMVRRYEHYFRLMDDIVIVCRDHLHARKALRDLVIALRRLRLNVNTKKTHILSYDDEKVDEHLPPPNRRIEEIDTLLKSRRLSTFKRGLPLLREFTLETLQSDDVDETALRFCLNRLERINRVRGIRIAWKPVTEALLPQLRDRPWTTAPITKYLVTAPIDSSQLGEVERVVLDRHVAIYEWQNYHLWIALGYHEIKTKALLHRARAMTRTRGPVPTRAAAILYLGKCGTSADREKIAKEYGRVRSPFLKRAILLATQKTPKSTARRQILPYLTPETRSTHQWLTRREASPIYYVKPYPLTPSEFFDDLPSISGP